jgi:hypothetical protein
MLSGYNKFQNARSGLILLVMAMFASMSFALPLSDHCDHEHIDRAECATAHNGCACVAHSSSMLAEKYGLPVIPPVNASLILTDATNTGTLLSSPPFKPPRA